MPKIIQNVTEIDGYKFSPTTTWYCESVSELNDIPESVSAGSIAYILTNNGLSVKMKNSSGSWIDL